MNVSSASTVFLVNRTALFLNQRQRSTRPPLPTPRLATSMWKVHTVRREPFFLSIPHFASRWLFARSMNCARLHFPHSTWALASHYPPFVHFKSAKLAGLEKAKTGLQKVWESYGIVTCTRPKFQKGLFFSALFVLSWRRRRMEAFP